MSKGKYSERARSKKDADERLRIAVTTQNQLTSRLAELRRVKEENQHLREANKELHAQIEAQTSGRVRELERAEMVLLQRCAIAENAARDIQARWEKVFDAFAKRVPRDQMAVWGDHLKKIMREGFGTEANIAENPDLLPGKTFADKKVAHERIVRARRKPAEYQSPKRTLI